YDIPSTAYSDGAYVLRVRAKDQSNNISYFSSSFTVFGAGSNAGDFTPPTLTMTFPVDGQSYPADQMLQFTGTSTDNVSVSAVDVEIKKPSTGESWNGSMWTAGDFFLLAN